MGEGSKFADAMTDGEIVSDLGSLGSLSGKQIRLVAGDLLFAYYGLYKAVGVGSPWGVPYAVGERQSPSELGACLHCAGYPIDTASGAFMHTFGDVAIPGRGVPLSLSRTYMSLNVGQAGPFGDGWSYNLGLSLVLNTPAAGQVTVKEETGSQIVFVPDGAGGFKPQSPRILAALSLSGSTYNFTRRQTQTFTFDSTSGKLTGLDDLNGFTTTVQYLTNQIKVTAPAPDSRTLVLNFDAAHPTRVTSVVDPIGRTVKYVYDASWTYLTDVTDGRGGHTLFGYDATTHRMITMTDPNGHAVTTHYDPSGRADYQWDRNNQKTTFAYAVTDPACPVAGATGTKITSPPATDPLGTVSVDSYANGLLVCQTHGFGSPEAATTQYGYDPVTLGRTMTKDPLGHVSGAGYDSRGNLTSTIDPLGRVTLLTYNAFNEVLTARDALYNATAFPDVTTFTYGDATTTPPTPPFVRTKTERPLLDGAGQVMFTQTETYRYDTAYVSGTSGPQYLDRTAMVDAAGKTWSTAFSGNYGYPVSSTDPLAHKATATFDAVGRATSGISPNGNTGTPNNAYRSVVAYDAAGHALFGANELGAGQTDSFGRLTSAASLGVMDTGVVWTAATGTWGINNGAYLATAAGTANMATVPAAKDLAAVFAAPVLQVGTGLVFRQKNTTNYWTVTAQQTAGVWSWLLRETKNGVAVGAGTTLSCGPTAAPVTCTGRDAVGVAASGTSIVVSIAGVAKPAVTDPDFGADVTAKNIGPFATAVGVGRITPIAFDVAPGGTQWTGYDANGNLGWANDANGHHTSSTRDFEDRPLVTTRADGTTVATDYYGNGTLHDQIDAQNHKTVYTYDHLNRPKTVTDPANRTISTNYDQASRVTSVFNPDHATAANPQATYSYDDANQVTAVRYGTFAGAVYTADPGTSDVSSITYDPLGRRTSMSDGSGVSSWAYNSLGQLTAHGAGNGDAVIYTPDLKGQVTDITYPGGLAHPVHRHFDDAGRLDSVADFTAAAAVTGFGYDASGNLTSGTLPTSGGATVVSYNYDVANRLITGSGHPGITVAHGATALGSFDYTRDNQGQLTSAVATGAVAQNEVYGYSALNQLTTVNAPATYTYDAADNPTGFVYGATMQYTGTGGLANQPATRSNGLTSAVLNTYTSDNEGNRHIDQVAGGATNTYNYDKANRLSQYVGVANYSYDGDGLRAAKVVWTVPTKFTWDVAHANARLLREGNGTIYTYYVYGPDGLPFQQTTINGAAVTTTYLTHDQNGSTRILVAPAGTTSGTYTYDPYGRVTAHTGVATSLQYDGEYADGDNGFIYLRHRYYDPLTGLFLSRDPLNSMTRSAYGYVGGSPLNGSDPSGLWGPFDADSDGPLAGMCVVHVSCSEDPTQASNVVGFCVRGWSCVDPNQLSLADTNETARTVRSVAITVLVVDVAFCVLATACIAPVLAAVQALPAANAMGTTGVTAGGGTVATIKIGQWSPPKWFEDLGGYEDDFDPVHTNVCDFIAEALGLHSNN